MKKKVLSLVVVLLVSAASVSYGASKKIAVPTVKDPVKKGVVLPVSQPEVKRNRGSLDVGYFAGSLGIRAGLRLPKEMFQMEPSLIAGYGLGQGYGVSLLQAELGNYTGTYNYGVSVDLAGYSARVLGIPGLPDVIESGSRLGLGAFVGTEIKGQAMRLGYSSALGYTLLISKKF